MWKKPITLKCFLLVLLILSVFVLYLVITASNTYFPRQIGIFSKSKDRLPANHLPQGFQSYKVLTDSSKSLKIVQVDFDSLDVKKGKTQTVTVYVEDTKNNSITEQNKVEAIVYQDNTSTSFSFEFKEANGSDTTTITKWQGSWECKDTHETIYKMDITAKSADNSDSVVLTFR